MDSRLIAELILHIGRIASGDGVVEGLTPVQWTVLRYFSRANRFSRTPSAFAAFHGTTRGTASQAIKNVAEQGYLRQIASRSDGRSVRLDLTAKARAIIANDPLEALVRAADALPRGVRGHFSKVLQRMRDDVASTTGKPLFGTCETCAHLESHPCSEEEPALCACGLFDEPLIEQELGDLCINFTPAKPGQPTTVSVRFP